MKTVELIGNDIVIDRYNSCVNKEKKNMVIVYNERTKMAEAHPENKVKIDKQEMSRYYYHKIVKAITMCYGARAIHDELKKRRLLLFS